MGCDNGHVCVPNQWRYALFVYEASPLLRWPPTSDYIDIRKLDIKTHQDIWEAIQPDIVVRDAVSVWLVSRNQRSVWHVIDFSLLNGPLNHKNPSSGGDVLQKQKTVSYLISLDMLKLFSW